MSIVYVLCKNTIKRKRVTASEPIMAYENAADAERQRLVNNAQSKSNALGEEFWSVSTLTCLSKIK